MFGFIKSRMTPTPKQILTIWAGVVVLKAALIGGYIYYIFSTQRVHDAAGDGDLVRMREILDREPDRLNRRSHYGYTPLHTAAMCGQSAALEELVRRGADVDARYDGDTYGRGWTALHITAREGHVVAATVLIRAGADVNARTERGDTPLGIALDRGHYEIAGLLRDAGAVAPVPR